MQTNGVRRREAKRHAASGPRGNSPGFQKPLSRPTPGRMDSRKVLVMMEVVNKVYFLVYIVYILSHSGSRQLRSAFAKLWRDGPVAVTDSGFRSSGG